MKPKIFSEITGKTHGIKFKMNPPIKPKSRKVASPREGAETLADPICGALSSHPARTLPLGCCEKRTRPAIEERFLSGDSIGIRNVTSLDLRDSSAGWPTTVSADGSR